MTKNTFLYTYNAKFCEEWDITSEEITLRLEEEIKKARKNNHAVIITGKGFDNKSFFDAYSGDVLTKNFTWIHFSPQEILNFDDNDAKGKYYVSTFSACARDGIYI